jgi:hypothetical protein
MALFDSTNLPPHFLQNLAPARFCSPQLAQTASSRDPHSSQNAASSWFSYAHRAHLIPSLRQLGRHRSRKDSSPGG